MTVGPLAADVSAYNLVLRNGASPDGDVTHGVLVLGGVIDSHWPAALFATTRATVCTSLGRMSCPPSSPSPRT